MVSIPACHAGDRGSIPRRGAILFIKLTRNTQIDVQQLPKKKCSATGNRTPVSRVTGGDTHHYTIVESLAMPINANYIEITKLHIKEFNCFN